MTVKSVSINGAGCKSGGCAFQLIKRRPRDVQRTKCRVDVKAGNWRNESVLPLGLCEHKPILPKAERVAGLLLGGLLLDAIGVSSFLERHRHAKGDSFLPFAGLEAGGAIPPAYSPVPIGCGPTASSTLYGLTFRA